MPGGKNNDPAEIVNDIGWYYVHFTVAQYSLQSGPYHTFDDAERCALAVETAVPLVVGMWSIES